MVSGWATCCPDRRTDADPLSRSTTIPTLKTAVLGDLSLYSRTAI